MPGRCLCRYWLLRLLKQVDFDECDVSRAHIMSILRQLYRLPIYDCVLNFSWPAALLYKAAVSAMATSIVRRRSLRPRARFQEIAQVWAIDHSLLLDRVSLSETTRAYTLSAYVTLNLGLSSLLFTGC